MNLYEKFSFVGHFYIPEDYANRFSGELIYDPEKGARIEAIFAGEVLFVKDSRCVIYGNIVELGKVSLIVDVSEGELQNSKGLLRSEITLDVLSGVVGKHLDIESKKIKKCVFKFDSFSHFLYEGHKRELDTLTNELAVGYIENLRISLIHSHKNTFFELKAVEGEELAHFFMAINRITRLFMVLCMKSMEPSEVTIYETNTSDGDSSLPLAVVPYTIMTSKMLKERHKGFNKILLRTVNFFSFPDFSQVINRWNQRYSEGMDLFLEAAFSRFALNTSAYHQLLILCAAIEQWKSINNVKSSFVQDFICRYAGEEIKLMFIENLPIQKNEEIGKAVFDLRNCLIHPKKKEENAFKKYKKCLNEVNVGNVNECLFVCFFTQIYEELGLSRSCFDKVLERQKKFISTYSKLSV